MQEQGAEPGPLPEQPVLLSAEPSPQFRGVRLLGALRREYLVVGWLLMLAWSS